MIMILLGTVRPLLLAKLQKLLSLLIGLDLALLGTMHFVVDNFEVGAARVEQVVDLFVIDFYVRYRHSHFFLLKQFLADVIQGVVNEPVAVLVTQHCKSLS